MKKLILLLVLATLSVPAIAATTQQDKMTSCNAGAKARNLGGEERKKFMSECLAAKPAAPAKAEDKKLTPQQAKMKACNADPKAKTLKGEERKKFMSECLKA